MPRQSTTCSWTRLSLVLLLTLFRWQYCHAYGYNMDKIPQNAFQRRFQQQIRTKQGSLSAKKKDVEAKIDDTITISKDEEDKFLASLQELMSKTTIGEEPLNIRRHERVRETLKDLRNIAVQQKLQFSSTSAATSKEKARMDAVETQLNEQSRFEMDQSMPLTGSLGADDDGVANKEDVSDFSSDQSMPSSSAAAMSINDMKELAKMYTNDVNSEIIATDVIREVEQQLQVPPPPTPAEDEANLANATAAAKMDGKQSGASSTSSVVAEKAGKGKRGTASSASAKSLTETNIANGIRETDETLVTGPPAVNLSTPPQSSGSIPPSPVSTSTSSTASLLSSAPGSAASSSASPSPSPSPSMATGLEDISSVFEWDGASKRAKLRLYKAIDEELMTEYSGLFCPECSYPVEQHELDDHGKCYLCRGKELAGARVVEDEEIAAAPSRRAEYEQRRAALASARDTPYLASDTSSEPAMGASSATIGPGPVLDAELDAQGVYIASFGVKRPPNPIVDAAGDTTGYVLNKLKELFERMENTEESLVDVLEEFDRITQMNVVRDARQEGVIDNIAKLEATSEVVDARIKALETRVEQLENLLQKKFASFE